MATCDKAVTLPNIGVPQYIGVPPPTYLPTVPRVGTGFDHVQGYLAYENDRPPRTPLGP